MAGRIRGAQARDAAAGEPVEVGTGGERMCHHRLHARGAGFVQEARGGHQGGAAGDHVVNQNGRSAADLADIVAGPSAPGVSIAYGTVVAADSRTVDVRIGGSVVAGSAYRASTVRKRSVPSGLVTLFSARLKRPATSGPA